MQQIIPEYQVLLLGQPKIYKGGKEVIFPFLKARVLALLLLEEREMERDKVCALLWENKSLETGRRNLSNAMSCIRRDNRLFCANSRSVYLDPQIGVNRDTDRINDLDHLEWDAIQALLNPFMDAVDIKEGVAFEEWVRYKRERYRCGLVDALKKRAQIRQEEEGRDAILDAVTCYEKMTELDPYDECIHADLTRLYIKTGHRVAATKVARDFSRRIEAELGISNKRTRVSPLLVRVLKPHGIPANVAPEDDDPLARKRELSEVLDFLRLSRASSSCTCIWGEEGIGKTSLVKEVVTKLEENGWLCLTVKSFREERHYPMSPLIRLLKKLHQKLPLEQAPYSRFKRNYLASCFPFLGKEMKDTDGDSFKGSLSSTELNPTLIAEIILEYISFVASDTCLIAVQEIQWMDETSWSILETIIRNWGPQRHMLVSGYEESRSLLDGRAVFESASLERLEVYLKCFDVGQTMLICKKMFPDQEWPEDRVSAVYTQTEGNPFLIREYLRFSEQAPSGSIFRGAGSLFTARLGMLNEEERFLLEGVSVFHGEASLQQLSILLDRDPLRLAECCKKNIEHGFLREREEKGDVLLAFTHSKVKKLVLVEMPKTLNNILHRKMLESLEAHQKKYPADRRLYPQLFYYCKKLGLDEKELSWRLKELAIHFQATHEVFPVLSDPELIHYIPSLDDMKYTKQSLSEIRTIIDRRIRLYGRSSKLNSMERSLFTIEGGYLWWSGKYEDAASFLKEALQCAIREDKPKAIIEVCMQLCYLSIQTDNEEGLRRYAKRIFLLARTKHYHPWMGVSMRFLAISYIMTGNTNTALRLLQMSIRLFEKIEEEGASYTVSLIAAEYIQGDLQIAIGNRRKALSHYLSCIRIGESLGLYRGLGLALAKAGYCYLRLGNLAKSEEVLNRIENFCEITRLDWNGNLQGGGIALSLLGLLSAIKGNWERSRMYFELAENLDERIGRPTWRGIFLWSKSELFLYIKDAPESFVAGVLPHSREWYSEEAIRMLARIGWVYELE